MRIVCCRSIAVPAGFSGMKPAGHPSEGGQIPNPADAFFKECLSNIPAARGFLREHFPPGMAAEARWMSLKREPESFLDATLRSKFADLLFSVPLRDGTAFAYVLVEHKSTPEHWTLFHLLELMVPIWRKHLDNTGYAQGPLPVIVPLVFHQGPKAWTLSKQFSDYFGVDRLGTGEWLQFIPRFEHLLVDLSKMPWESIRGEALLRITLGLMKAVRERKVAEVLPKLAPLLAELGPSGTPAHFLQALARYLLEVEDMSASTIYDLANKLENKKAKSQFMTLAENLRKEGREEGREEGLQRGLQKGVIVGQILNCQEILGRAPAAKEALAEESVEELRAMLHQLKTEVSKLLKQ